MQRTEPVGTSMLVMTRARQVAYLCSWQCTSISVSSPHPFQKCALSFQLCLFHCLSFSILLHGFERFLDVSIHLYVCAFLPFFLTQVFTPFHICASLFSASFCSFFLFSLQFSFIPSFRALVSSPSTLLFCALHLTRLSPCLFQFSSQSSRNVRLLTTYIPPYSPRIVVIMLILTTLGWCPLNVISSKISAFLSADFQ